MVKKKLRIFFCVLSVNDDDFFPKFSSFTYQILGRRTTTKVMLVLFFSLLRLVLPQTDICITRSRQPKSCSLLLTLTVSNHDGWVETSKYVAIKRQSVIPLVISYLLHFYNSITIGNFNETHNKFTGNVEVDAAIHLRAIAFGNKNYTEVFFGGPPSMNLFAKATFAIEGVSQGHKTTPHILCCPFAQEFSFLFHRLHTSSKNVCHTFGGGTTHLFWL